jgi:thimet oligopeptidase
MRTDRGFFRVLACATTWNLVAVVVSREGSAVRFLSNPFDHDHAHRRLGRSRRASLLGSLVLAAASLGAACHSPGPTTPTPATPIASSSSAGSVSSAAPTPPPMTALAPLDVDPVAVGMTAEGIVELCDESLATAEKLLAEIRTLAAAKDDALTFAATIGKLDDATLAMRNGSEFAELMSVAHPDKAVRDAAKTVSPKVDKMATTLYLDKDLAQVFKRYAAKKEKLAGPEALLLEHTLRDYRRNGLDLDEKSQARLRELNERITKVSQDFEANIADSNLSITVTAKDLEGLPQAYIDSHKPDDKGEIKLTTDYPDVFPFLQYAKNRDAALQLGKQFDNRAADKNVALLDELLKLRHEKAKLLGYPTWADYVLEPRMAKNAATVKAFLASIRTHLEKHGKAEFAELKAMSDKLVGKRDAIPPSDRLYLEDQLRSKKYGLDSKKVSEYFEVGRVQQGVMDISARLYGITFRPAKGLPAWHPEVQPMEILDKDGKVIGRFYFDLHPREGKYKHAAVFGIRSSKKMADGSRQMPIAAIVCNFPKGTPDSPALMSHQDAVTFFHEFGHVLHHLLTTSQLATFSGTSVARDFVEAPSQMFEEWAWSKETLALFAKHYKTNEPIPEKLYTSMIKARSFGRAVSTQRQLFLAALDQEYHTREPGFDTTKVLQEIHDSYTPFRYQEGTHFQATFGHLIGYDAGYYGYQWALSIARDMFTRFQKAGQLDPQTAAAYREKVLAPGGSADANDLLRDFLGRAPSDAAYKAFLDGK